MYFLDKQEVINVLEIDDVTYNKVIKPIQELFIDFDTVIEDIDRSYKFKIDFAIMCMTEKLLRYMKIMDSIKLEMKKKQFYIMSNITKESEIIIPEIQKICLDKKKMDNEKYKDYIFLDITKTHTYEFANIIVETHYETFFKDNHAFKDGKGNMYKVDDLSFRMGIIKNAISYLKSVTYNV